MFTTDEELEYTIATIKQYPVLYDKIFVLSIGDDSYVCTFNIDKQLSHAIPNALLLHRRKHTNTLYTINSLNELVKSLNNGQLDHSFMINWEDYKNSLLIISNGELNILSTELHSVISVN